VRPGPQNNRSAKPCRFKVGLTKAIESPALSDQKAGPRAPEHPAEFLGSLPKKHSYRKAASPAQMRLCTCSIRSTGLASSRRSFQGL